MPKGITSVTGAQGLTLQKISFPFLSVSRKNKQLTASDIMPALLVLSFALILCISAYNNLQVCSFLLPLLKESVSLVRFSLIPETNAPKHTGFSLDTCRRPGARLTGLWSGLVLTGKTNWVGSVSISPKQSKLVGWGR